ncbi:Uncharacterised protein [Mycobacteroides abscessus subsp. abscessus]|nr:Uncharacterised protein [Mycobacteroides abscessus subsp. abscessus]
MASASTAYRPAPRIAVCAPTAPLMSTLKVSVPSADTPRSVTSICAAVGSKPGASAPPVAGCHPECSATNARAGMRP